MQEGNAACRRNPFEVGQSYVALQSFGGFASADFVAGLVYALRRIAYSHYDSATICCFEESRNGSQCQWGWSDELSVKQLNAEFNQRFRVAP
jgi:hypothetical protein